MKLSEIDAAAYDTPPVSLGLRTVMIVQSVVEENVPMNFYSYFMSLTRGGQSSQVTVKKGISTFQPIARVKKRERVKE